MTPLRELQNSAHHLLLHSGLTLAVAESCTSGLLGAALTELPGSSAYFLGGVLAYSDSVKAGLLGVDDALIRDFGAVSRHVALAMARGVILATGATAGVSITGIAGPTGATDTKPVGTTYVALVAPCVAQVEEFHWSGTRAENRASSVLAAYEILLRYLRRSSLGREPDKSGETSAMYNPRTILDKRDVVVSNDHAG